MTGGLLVRMACSRAIRSASLILGLALVAGCASTPANNQTTEFRHFVRDFFADPQFQIAHVRFPLEQLAYDYSDEDDDFVLTRQYISRDDWEHLPGPDFYRCQTDCYDLVIYDSFDKRHRPSDERVLAFEGVSNGINSSLYFQRVSGEWLLVKYEQFDN